VGEWLQNLVLRGRVQFVFANQFYDTGWLSAELGVEFPEGRCHDVLLMASLDEEERPGNYSLDGTARFYGLKGKDETTLSAAAGMFGVDEKRDMWRMPPQFVAAYAMKDAEQTLLLHEILLKRIRDQHLDEVFELETALTPVLLAISRRGVPVDIKAADQLNEAWKAKEKALRDQLGGLDIWSGPQIAHYLGKLGLKVPLTAKGNPSVKKDVLESLNHPAVTLIQDARAINRARQTYIEDLILKPNRPIIHPEFVQIAREEGGTRTGRLACRNPNLQQVPIRNKAIEAHLIRTLFIPPKGEQWAKADYSSAEPRLQVHYALIKDLPGAAEAAAVFARGEKLYGYLEKAAGISYDDAKAAMLARSYGMGVPSFSRKYEKTEAESRSILTSFDELCPYIGELASDLRSLADKRGWIRTLGGRKRHFNYWEPDTWQLELRHGESWEPVYGLEKARNHWPDRPIRRAYVNKAFNALIQGSSADVMKKALIGLHQAGFRPCLTVHDEINSFVRNMEEALEMKRIMEHVYDLRCPMVADLKVGSSWR